MSASAEEQNSSIPTDEGMYEDKGGSGDAPSLSKERKPSNTSPSAPPPTLHGITKLRNFIKSNRIDFSMWVLRVVTIFFVLASVIPIFEPTSLYIRRALIANAATSALRLHQRVRLSFTMSKESLARLVMEDSTHYIIYSLMFLFLGSFSFTLMPIAFFSTLHAASFTLKMLEAVKGPTARLCAFGSLLHVWTFKTNWILKMAAMAELTLMGVILMACMRGAASIFLPFVYYRFITFRYASRRNPFLRNLMYEMRMGTERFLAAGNCPGLLARIIRVGIVVLCKLAPPMPSTQPQSS